MDIEDIIKNNEYSYKDKKFFYIKNKDISDNLIVIFSAYKNNTYFYVKHFLKNQKTDLLFLTDLNNTWYLDNDYGQTYIDILNQYIHLYPKENISFLGESMGGYAALHFGLKLDCNVISCNPQINIDISKKYAPDYVKEDINKLTKYVNIDKIACKDNKSVVYIAYSHYLLDIANIKKLFSANIPNAKVILQKVDCDRHIYFFFGKKTDYVYDLHNLCKYYRKIANIEYDNIIYPSFPNENDNKNRIRRHKNNIQHPYYQYNNNIIWEEKEEYEKSGNVVLFENCGVASKDEFSGVLCYYAKDKWKVLSGYENAQISSISFDNIKENVFFNTNNDIIDDNIWLRVGNNTKTIVSKYQDKIKVYTQSEEKDISYINFGLKNIAEDYSGRWITLCVNISSTSKFSLTLGGVDLEGYFHSNSEIYDTCKNKNIYFCAPIYNHLKEHKDKFFARINFHPDKEHKNIEISDIKIISGFFPMGI